MKETRLKKALSSQGFAETIAGPSPPGTKPRQHALTASREHTRQARRGERVRAPPPRTSRPRWADTWHARCPSSLGGYALLVALSACAGPTSRADVAGGPTRHDPLTQARRLEARGATGDALVEVERVVASHPTLGEAHALRGRLLAQEGRLEESARAYERARTLGDASRRTALELASLYDVTGEYAKAIAIYEGRLARNPRDVEVRHELGLTRLLAGDVTGGVAALERAARDAPRDGEIKADLALAWMAAGEIERATTLLETEAGRAKPHPAILRLLAEQRARAGRLHEALDLVDRALHIDDHHLASRKLRGQLRLTLGDSPGALEDLGAVWRRDPEDLGALLDLAGALIGVGRVEEAAEAIARARREGAPEEAIALREGQLLGEHDPRAGLEALLRFVRAHPRHLEAWRLVEALAKRSGDTAVLETARKKLASFGLRASSPHAP